MEDLWRDRDTGAREIDRLVYLSNLIGRDPSLTQPGGGNTSLKLDEADLFGCETRTLVVKGSGTDLRTIDASGLTHLYLDRLALVQGRDAITDAEMMRLMRATMLYPDRDPVPSVETPLHSLLPYRVIAHTHDVATLSLSDTPHAEENVSRVFGREVAFLSYARPGFPLARRLAERCAEGPLDPARALVLEKHGLVVWGETAKECYASLLAVINKAEAFVEEQGRGKRVFGLPAAPALDESRRRALASALLPVIRGELAEGGWRPVLHLDDSAEMLERISGERFPQVASRGVMTPEHILRVGKQPLVLELDLGRPPDERKAHIREAMGDAREQYRVYATAHGQTEPIADFLKVVVIPGLGVVCAGKDRRNALVAADCYRATVRAMEGAEAVERFEFLTDDDACEMEYWPLERRKVEESARSRRELDGKVAVVIGAASGIGRASARRFADEGAHVVLADVDAEGARVLASEINDPLPELALAVEADVSDATAIEDLFRAAALHFGGVDVLFYSPGVGPRFHPVLDLPDAEIEEKMSVHFTGAVRATREAARIMLDQGRGGRLVYNASKAAFAPGEGFAAYGASKAALAHFVRNVANELGRHGITANYVNADAVDTPLFRDLLRRRAQQAGRSEEELLQSYEQRSVLRQATVPPEAVADVVLFLASDRSAYTTGCVITVGGGHEGFPR